MKLLPEKVGWNSVLEAIGQPVSSASLKKTGDFAPSQSPSLPACEALVFFDSERDGVKQVLPSAGWLSKVRIAGVAAAPAPRNLRRRGSGLA